MKKFFGVFLILTLSLLAFTACAGAESPRGEDGKTPTIEINGDGYWVINGETTNVLAGTIVAEEGTKGLVYYPKDDGTYAVAAGTTKYLSDIVIPASYQGKPVTEIAEYGFEQHNLKSITIPDSVTSIGSYAFYDCDALTSVTIGNSVTSIGGWAFMDCSSLASVTIGNSVTSIGGYAFSGCSSLTSVTIPDSVTSIGDWAFSGCSSLTSVCYKGDAAEWNAISIGYSNSSLTNATRYYYSEEAPTDDGRYWHYDADGKVAVW